MAGKAWNIKAPASAYVVPDEVQQEQLDRRGIDLARAVGDLETAIMLNMSATPGKHVYAGTVEPDERERRRAKSKAQRASRKQNRRKR